MYLVHDIKKIDLSHDVNKRQQAKVLTHAEGHNSVFMQQTFESI